MHDPEEAGNHRDAVMQGEPVRDRPLAEAVERDNGEGDEEVILAHGEVCVSRLSRFGAWGNGRQARSGFEHALGRVNEV